MTLSWTTKFKSDEAKIKGLSFCLGRSRMADYEMFLIYGSVLYYTFAYKSPLLLPTLNCSDSTLPSMESCVKMGETFDCLNMASRR